MTRGKRFFLYCQHLAGTGHFVRTHEIALALAERHEVFLVDGGRPIPRLSSADRLTLVPLPRIYRGEQSIAPLESARRLDDVMHQRRQDLLQAIERIGPDVADDRTFSLQQMGAVRRDYSRPRVRAGRQYGGACGVLFA